MHRVALVAGPVLLAGGCVAGSRPAPIPPRALEPFTETIPGTGVSFDLVPVEGGPGPFWIGRTEVTWDAYDVFVFGLDEPEGAGDVDAVTRPSRPYISMDLGFGHAGYPAISMSHHAAASFCVWLSGRTGRRYRLPTEAEWRHACVTGGIDPDRIEESAWFGGNADFSTHPVATRAPDARGVHDMYGNASEWCDGDGGEPVTMGGSYRDPPAAVGCAARRPPSDDWNRSDPQIPRSIWWLADAGFVGFRLVCVPAEGEEP